MKIIHKIFASIEVLSSLLMVLYFINKGLALNILLDSRIKSILLIIICFGAASLFYKAVKGIGGLRLKKNTPKSPPRWLLFLLTFPLIFLLYVPTAVSESIEEMIFIYFLLGVILIGGVAHRYFEISYRK